MKRPALGSETPQQPAEELREKIDFFLLEHSRPMLTEPGQDVVDLSVSSYSLSTQYDKLIWHIWNENTNLVRQVTAIQRERPGRMELRYQKFGKGPAGTLVLADSRAMPESLERRTRRTLYVKTLRRWLLQLFPEWKVQELTTEPDMARSFSRRFARGRITRGRHAWAVIGSGESDDGASAGIASDDILAYGLLWLDWLRSANHAHVIEGLKIFLPQGTAEITLNRLAWMNPQAAKWELYETGFATGGVTGDGARQRDPADFGNLKTSLAPFNSPTARQVVKDWGGQIGSASPEVEARPGPDGYWSWAVRGLLFARETNRGIVFGLGRAETLLEQGTVGELQKLVARIDRVRRPDSREMAHPLFRSQPERWMECVVSRNMGRIESSLAGGMVYQQVPSVSGTSRGLLDLLTVDACGRLAVVELKASEDLQLPLQALDYWMRVRWHQQRGALERQGYFGGRALSPEPPLLLLVSPALQFHSACETILRYISPAIEIVRVGINEEWRRELNVVFREGRSQRQASDRNTQGRISK